MRWASCRMVHERRNEGFMKDTFVEKKWIPGSRYIYEDGQVIADLGPVLEEHCPLRWCPHPLRRASFRDGHQVTVCMGNLVERPDGQYDAVPHGECGE